MILFVKLWQAQVEIFNFFPPLLAFFQQCTLEMLWASLVQIEIWHKKSVSEIPNCDPIPMFNG